MTSDYGGISSFGQLRPKTASNSDRGQFDNRKYIIEVIYSNSEQDSSNNKDEDGGWSSPVWESTMYS